MYTRLKYGTDRNWKVMCERDSINKIHNAPWRLYESPIHIARISLINKIYHLNENELYLYTIC